MKGLIINIFLLLPIVLDGQYHYNIRPVTKDVIKIEETHFNGTFRKSGWKSHYEYSDGNLIRQRNWYKNDLRLDEKHMYSKHDSFIIMRTVDLNGSVSIVKESILNQSKKKEIYLSNDTINPSIVLHSFVYDDANRLISYKWSSDYKGEAKTTNCSKFSYQKNKIFIQESEECERINKTIIIELDEKGNPIFERIDYHDTAIVVVGGRSEKGVQRYKYKFDKKGNWIKRYYVSAEGESVLEIKRKIKYK